MRYLRIIWRIVDFTVSILLCLLLSVVIGIVLGSIISLLIDDHGSSLFLLLGALIGILVISVLVHRAGHFIAAKLCKIRVYVFAVGVGRTLLRWKRGGTEYRVNAVPCWAYIETAGDGLNDNERNAANEYGSQPIWRRAIVLFAGPAANAIVAFFAIWAMYIYCGERPTYLDNGARIGSVRWDSPADSVGFLVGDSIVSINDSSVANWKQVETLLFEQQRDDYKIVVLRGGNPVEFNLRVDRSGTGMPTDGLSPASVPSVVGKVMPKSGADGVLKVGDTILAFKGVPVSHIEEVYDLMYSRLTPKGDSAAVDFDIKRGGELLRVVVVPKYVSADGYYSLGIKSVPEPTRIKRDGALAALRPALNRALELSTMLVDVYDSVTSKEKVHKSPPSMIDDPIIFGLTYILNIMGFIGINLALVSLVIDGGFLIALGIEAIRGKPLSAKRRELVF